MTQQSLSYISVLLLSLATVAPAGQVGPGTAADRPFYVLPLWLQYSSAAEEQGLGANGRKRRLRSQNAKSLPPSQFTNRNNPSRADGHGQPDALDSPTFSIIHGLTH